MIMLKCIKKKLYSPFAVYKVSNVPILQGHWVGNHYDGRNQFEFKSLHTKSIFSRDSVSAVIYNNINL